MGFFDLFSKSKKIAGIVKNENMQSLISRSKKFHELSFTFSHWVDEKGSVNESDLYITKIHMSDEELNNIIKFIKPFEILSVKVTKFKRLGKTGMFSAKLTSLNDNHNVPELNVLVDNLKRNNLYVDDLWGVFCRNDCSDNYDSWVGEAFWMGVKVDLDITAQKNKVFEAFFTAKKIFEKMNYWHDIFIKQSAKELVQIKNDGWLENGDAPINEEEIKNRMQIESISIWYDGDFVFYFDDDDVFWGHSIEIKGNLNKGIESIGL